MRSAPATEDAHVTHTLHTWVTCTWIHTCTHHIHMSHAVSHLVPHGLPTGRQRPRAMGTNRVWTAFMVSAPCVLSLESGSRDPEWTVMASGHVPDGAMGT